MQTPHKPSQREVYFPGGGSRITAISIWTLAVLITIAIVMGLVALLQLKG